MQLEVRVEWQIQHEAKPSAVFVTGLIQRAVYYHTNEVAVL